MKWESCWPCCWRWWPAATWCACCRSRCRCRWCRSRSARSLPAAQATACGSSRDIFFLVFLPPLLFLDGWRIPKIGLFRDRATILELALGLVVFTVLGAGFLIHWLIPSHAAGRSAFALAAILSPTDPVAVSSIAARVPIPHAPDAHPRGRIAAERRHWPGVLPLRRGRRPDRHLLAGRSHAHLPVGGAGGRGHRRRASRWA